MTAPELPLDEPLLSLDDVVPSVDDVEPSPVEVEVEPVVVSVVVAEPELVVAAAVDAVAVPIEPVAAITPHASTNAASTATITPRRIRPITRARSARRARAVSVMSHCVSVVVPPSSGAAP